MKLQTWTPEQVWAAAACAQRINGSYLKHDEYNEQGQKTKIRNIDLVRSALEDTTQIPEIDFEVGREALKYMSQRLTLKALKGQLREFDQVMTRVVDIAEFTDRNRYEIAVVASQINSYQQSKEDVEWQSQIDRSLGHLGNIGDKVEVDVHITKAVWSANFGIYFYQGISPKKQGVWFTYRKSIKHGSNVKIRGTVNRHRDFSTQLNRVKLVEGVAE